MRPRKKVREEKAPVFPPMTSKPALQKAETEWNTAIHIPAAPKDLQNAGSMTSAPRSSVRNATLKTKPVILTMPPIWWALMLSWSMLRCSSEILLPERVARNAATDTTPRPPIWIRIKITVCPNTDQCIAVSRMTSPVTQTAEVEVNSASSGAVQIRCFELTGSISSSVPIRMTPRKPDMMI